MKPYIGQIVLYQSESFVVVPPFAAIVARNLGNDTVNLSVLNAASAVWFPKLKVPYDAKGAQGTWRYTTDAELKAVDV